MKISIDGKYVMYYKTKIKKKLKRKYSNERKDYKRRKDFMQSNNYFKWNEYPYLSKDENIMLKKEP